MEQYEYLANAIVLRAAADYRIASRRLTVNPEYPPAQQLEADCEQFFLSGWFSVLTNVNGAALLERLKGEAK